MRLYRGLNEKYRPEQRPEALEGANFTDCPYAALLYAEGRHGQLLVLDVPDDETGVRVSKELWLRDRADRLMVWGNFDRFIVAIIPAKEVRKIVRAKGMGRMPESYKSDVLKWTIDRALSESSNLPILTIRSDPQEIAWRREFRELRTSGKKI